MGKGTKTAEHSNGAQALLALKRDLRKDDFAMIYHCYNHYFCPVGFESSPVLAHEAYAVDVKGESDHTLLVGDSSKKLRSVQAIAWEDVVKDLTLKNPRYFDVRKPHEGIQCKEGKPRGQGGETNCHCLMYFRRLP